MTNCYFCGKELPQGSNYCASCDHKTLSEDYFLKKPTYQKQSVVWYLLPIFLGVIGGLLAFFIIKEKDPLKAKYCLIIGIVATIVGLVSMNWIDTLNSVFT